MIYAFQDYEHLYLVMDLLTGGDLRYHISKVKKFTESQTSNTHLYIYNPIHTYIYIYRILYWLFVIRLRIHS